MARPQKQGLDYFPHMTKTDGKTLFTLEATFGNDGYAFWFKLLEILGLQEGLYYDCSSQINWLFLVAKAKIDTEKAEKIMQLLCDLEAIDKELWDAKKIIWVQNFVNNVVGVFNKRGSEVPLKPSFCHRNSTNEGVSVTESTQRKEEKSKVKKSREKERKEGGVGETETGVAVAPSLSKSKFVKPSVDEVAEYRTERGFSDAQKFAQRFVDFYESKGWFIGKVPMKEWRAAVRTWEQRDTTNEAKKVPPQKNEPTGFIKKVLDRQRKIEEAINDY